MWCNCLEFFLLGLVALLMSFLGLFVCDVGELCSVCPVVCFSFLFSFWFLIFLMLFCLLGPVCVFLLAWFDHLLCLAVFSDARLLCVAVVWGYFCCLV